MERLTVKWSDKNYDTFDPVDIVDNEYSKVNYNKILTKLGEYEDLEEQGTMKCNDCINNYKCLDRIKIPDLMGCSSGVPIHKVLTNADRIRSMSDEELLDFICSIETYDDGSAKTIEGGVAMCSVSEVEEWLQSPADEKEDDE